jgi:hypothetical protein
MNDMKVWRWTGAFGLAIVALLLIEFSFRVALGMPPLLEDTKKSGHNMYLPDFV